jgi:hypothetical protein
MASWQVHAVLLPDGDSFVGGISAPGRWTPEPPAGAERLPGRYVLPGLADAHCHLSVGRNADGEPAALTVEETWANLAAAGVAGITVVRDVGSPAGIPGRPPPLTGEPVARADAPAMTTAG